jgi:multiple sugar transport system permease protein
MALATAILVYTLLIIWALIVLFPLYWVLITSVKLPADVNAGPVFLPWIDFTPSLHAWRDLFIVRFEDTLRAYLNSIIIALCATTFCIMIGSMAAYALGRLRYKPKFGVIAIFVICILAASIIVARWGVDWRLSFAVALALFFFLSRALGRYLKGTLGNSDILFWMISQRILPPVAVVIPVYVLFQQIGLRDSLAALIITYVAVNLPIVVWLMRDSFQAIPLELEESAMIDGASRFTVFRKIVLPISRPSLASAFLLMLILTWNEYLLALMLSTADTQTLPLLIAAQNATRGPQWWYMSVLILIMIVPVVAMAVALERYIRRGMLIGAVKG